MLLCFQNRGRYLPQNGSSSRVNRYILPRAGDLSEWYPMLPHLVLSLHGKHSPSRNFSYDSHGTAGNAQLGDTLSVKNLYARRWLHKLLPYTSGAAETETSNGWTLRRTVFWKSFLKRTEWQAKKRKEGWHVWGRSRSVWRSYYVSEVLWFKLAVWWPNFIRASSVLSIRPD